MSRAAAFAAALAAAIAAVAAACDAHPSGSDPVEDTTDGGVASYGEDGFECAVALSPQSCCGVAGCAASWDVASSCVMVASTPAPYVLDSSPCGGFLEAQQGTTFMLFDATSGSLVALLGGPGPQSSGFTCTAGPVALAIENDCLLHWQQTTASSPCTDAGALFSPPSAPDAGCALDAQAE